MMTGLPLHMRDQAEAAVVSEFIRLVEASLHRYALGFPCTATAYRQPKSLNQAIVTPEASPILHRTY